MILILSYTLAWWRLGSHRPSAYGRLLGQQECVIGMRDSKSDDVAGYVGLHYESSRLHMLTQPGEADPDG